MRLAVVTVGLLLSGALIWVVGVFAAGRLTGESCQGVMFERGYGAYHQSGDLAPPRLTCDLRGPDDAGEPDPLRVERLGPAVLRSAWTLGFPVVWVVGTAWFVRRLPAAGTSRSGTPVSSA